MKIMRLLLALVLVLALVAGAGAFTKLNSSRDIDFSTGAENVGPLTLIAPMELGGEAIINASLQAVLNFDINGFLDLLDIDAPSAPDAGTTRLYSKAGVLFYQNATGEYRLVCA